jgi:hemoglobin-like flavoprotein
MAVSTYRLTDEQRKEIARLRSTCELYDEYKPDWDFFLSAYEGGTKFINDSNLFKHSREQEEDFKDRVKRAHYMNYCEPLVDFFTDFIFAETIQRHGGSNDGFYQDFIKDVNLKNEDITVFMSDTSDDKQIKGIVYGMVDSPRLPSDRQLTKAEEQRLKIRPYWVLIQPEEVLDWVVDPFDKFQYLKRVQHLEEMIGFEKFRFEKYYEWTPSVVRITLIDITQPSKPKLLPAETIANAVGEVPFVPIRFKRSKRNKEMGESFLKNIAYQNREVMNLTSLLQEFLYRQCFNILAVQVDQQIPTQEQSQGEIGTANYLQYPKGAEKPAYISPDATPADKLHEERQTIINEMYKQAAQDTVNELFNGVKRSGYSQQQSFSTTVPRIASRAETLEKAENRMMELTMKYMGKTWDGKIKYKDRYELTNISDALSQMTQLFKDLQMPSETFVKQELKRMVHEMDGKIPADDLNRIEAEIDAMDFDEWKDTQKLALIGSAGKPPAGTTAAGATVAGKDKPAKKTPVRKPTTSAEAKAESNKGKG